MKKCPKCGENKELNLFYTSNSRFNKKSYLCKECHSLTRSMYDQTIKGRYVTYKSGAKKRGFIFTISLDEFISFWDKDCFYCGDKIKGIGLDRVDSTMGYEINNVVSCCKKCNMMKATSTYSNFINQCKKIVERHNNNE